MNVFVTKRDGIMGGLWRLNQREEKGENDGLFCQGGGVFPLLGWALLSGPDERRTGVSLATRWIVVPKAIPTQPADSTMRLLRATRLYSDTEPCFFRSGRLPGNF
jgi:hypothetical protein